MAIADSTVKFFRSFRISLKNDDKVDFKVVLNAHTKKTKIINDCLAKNISFTGMAFTCSDELKEGEKVSINFKFKKIDISVSGTIVRFLENESDHFTYGIEFEKDALRYNKSFLDEFINSFSTERLKEELEKSLIETRDKSLVFQQNDFELVIGLARMLNKFDHLEEFVEYLCHELKRIVNCWNVSFYFLEKDSYLLCKYTTGNSKVETNKLYNIQKSIVREFLGKNEVFNGVVINDDFYNFRLEKNQNISSLVSPLVDHYGNIVGCLEFTEKINALRFDHTDMAIARFVSQLLTFLLEELKSRAPSKKRNITKRNVKARKYALIGKSAEITKIRKEIVKQKESPGHLLITGEKGVGKRLLSDIIRTEGVLEKFQICFLNLKNPADYKAFQSMLDKEEKLNNIVLIVESFEKVGKKEFDLVSDIIHKKTTKAHKVLFHLIYTPPMEHEFDMSSFQNITLEVPSLKQRKSDFYHIFTHFLDKECETRGLPYKKLSKDVVDELSNNKWPGNIDELKRIVSRVIDIYPYHHFIYQLPDNEVFPVQSEKIDFKFYTKIVNRDLLKILSPEKVNQFLVSKFVVDRFHSYHNDKKRAAKSLGIDPNELDHYLHEFNEIWKQIA